jgi:hypothetical protein
MKRSVSLLAGLLLLTILPAQAQDAQSPSEFLGYELGSRFTRHHQIVSYFEHMGQFSDRVEVVAYGSTNEGRQLTLAFISTPENLANLEQIRTDNLRRANLLEGEPEGAKTAIVWLSYNVHGNESNSSEAAMATLHRLVDSQDDAAASWLENTVVILDPSLNPDGRDRYVNWYNRMVGMQMDADPMTVEHSEPWPGGRTNHYFFDLNRDWSWQTQVETRQRMERYKEWMPHVHIDFHEQGVNSPYYFAPAAEPVHEEVTEWQRELQEIIGRNHARYFDAEGWLYFTKESFDILYPGYGDSFPMFNGAIGMTYEQAGGGRAGLGIETALGDTLSLLDRLTHHTIAGLSTIEATAIHHERVVDEFAAYFERALSDPPGEYDAYVIRSATAGRRAARLATHLDRLGIEYGAAVADAQVSGMGYRTGRDGRHAIKAGDLVIPVAQPRAVLTRVLFDPEVVLSDTLTYDITGWALPFAYDVDAIATTSRVETTDWSDAVPDTKPNSRYPYAWVTRWDDAGDAAYLSALFKEGIIVRRNENPFAVDGITFDRGAVIVTRRNNERLGDSLVSRLEELAARHDQELIPVTTGFVNAGDDLGSSRVAGMKPPRIGMPFGSPLSSNNSGEVWHWFDQVIGYPLTRFPAERLGSMDLDEFDVIVLPSGSYGSLLPEAGLKHVREWVQDGGRVVALGSAASWLAGKEGMDLKIVEAVPQPDSVKLSDARDRRYVDRSRERSPDSSPGAVYRVRVDNTHPLAFGFGDTSFVLRKSSRHLAIMTGSGNWNVGIIQEDGRVSGHTGYRAERLVEGSLAFGVQSEGSGEWVFLPDNPLFRGFWQSGLQLFANAVFMARQ